MKCKECVANGQKSKVYPGYSTTTCAGVQTFYDEDGKFHIHDPNVTTTTYTCSNGHEWVEDKRSKCFCQEEK